MRVCSNQSTNNMGLRQKLDFQQLRIQSTRTIRLGTHLNCLEMMPIKTSSFILGFPVSHVWLPEGPLRVSTTKCGHMNMKTSNWMRDSVSSGGKINLVTTSSHSWEAYYHIYGSSYMKFFHLNLFSKTLHPKRLLNPLWGKSSPILSWLHPELCLNPKFLLGANPISGEWNPKFGWNPKFCWLKSCEILKSLNLGDTVSGTWIEGAHLARTFHGAGSGQEFQWPLHLFMAIWLPTLPFQPPGVSKKPLRATKNTPQLVIYCAVIRLLLSMTANWLLLYNPCCCFIVHEFDAGGTRQDPVLFSWWWNAKDAR